MLNHESAKERKHEKDLEFYLKELAGEECACGNQKSSGHSVCMRCYFALPGDMRKALYSRIGNGYEEAYEEAHSWLTQNLW